jgi:hypothetical protein
MDIWRNHFSKATGAIELNIHAMHRVRLPKWKQKKHKPPLSKVLGKADEKKREAKQKTNPIK